MPFGIFCPEVCYIYIIILNYTFFSQINWIILYIYYLYRIIVQNIPKESIQIKKDLIKDTIICIVTTLILIGNSKLNSDCVPHPRIISIFYVYISVITLVYTLAIITCFVLSYRVYKILKIKLNERKKATIAFAKIVFFPILVLFNYGLTILFLFLKEESQNFYYGVLCNSNISSVYLLAALLITNEFKDGIKMKRIKNENLISS